MPKRASAPITNFFKAKQPKIDEAVTKGHLTTCSNGNRASAPTDVGASEASEDTANVGHPNTLVDTFQHREVAASEEQTTSKVPPALKTDSAPKALAGPFLSARGIKAPSLQAGDEKLLQQASTPEALANWHEEAARRQTEAQGAVSAAQAAGKAPKLSSLLVETSWKAAVEAEFNRPHMASLQRFMEAEWVAHTVFPPQASIFRALNSCPFKQVKVVILGQDPYHNVGQAMGLSFSVPRGTVVPSSLRNILKELNTDLGCAPPAHGDLSQWAEQGVLLLNTCLTVRAHEANSHAKKGWETFTDTVISTVSKKRNGVVFILWGKPAQKKASMIDATRHTVLMSAHPSGLSAHRGFFGSAPFSKCNQLLETASIAPIRWQID